MGGSRDASSMANSLAIEHQTTYGGEPALRTRSMDFLESTTFAGLLQRSRSYGSSRYWRILALSRFPVFTGSSLVKVGTRPDGWPNAWVAGIRDQCAERRVPFFFIPYGGTRKHTSVDAADGSQKTMRLGKCSKREAEIPKNNVVPRETINEILPQCNQLWKTIVALSCHAPIEMSPSSVH